MLGGNQRQTNKNQITCREKEEKRINTDVEEKIWSGRNTGKGDSAVVGWSFSGEPEREWNTVLLCYISAEWPSVSSTNITILIVHYRTTEAHKWFSHRQRFNPACSNMHTEFLRFITIFTQVFSSGRKHTCFRTEVYFNYHKN